jgi:hypothetical protein
MTPAVLAATGALAFAVDTAVEPDALRLSLPPTIH